MVKQYGIMDDNGIIHQGSEEYIDELWGKAVYGAVDWEWSGDLIKFKILNTYR